MHYTYLRFTILTLQSTYLGLQLKALGSVRSQLAVEMSKAGHLVLDPEQLNFLWVTEFPLFEFDEEGQYTSQ